MFSDIVVTSTLIHSELRVVPIYCSAFIMVEESRLILDKITRQLNLINSVSPQFKMQLPDVRG